MTDKKNLAHLSNWDKLQCMAGGDTKAQGRFGQLLKEKFEKSSWVINYDLQNHSFLIVDQYFSILPIPRYDPLKI